MLEEDEFRFLEAEAHDIGIAWNGRPDVKRVAATITGGRTVSALRWGGPTPAAVLLHGGTQNAHTWDAMALCLSRPLLAIDLPGHGHSDWRPDGAYGAATLAAEVAEALGQLAPGPAPLVGMSLGGMVALQVAARRPELVSALVLVDITPGHRTTTETALNFFARRSFDTLDDLVSHAASLSGRADDSARRTLVHNARQRPDGQWEWRHHFAQGIDARSEYTAMWDDLARLRIPLMLVRGGRSPLVTEAHVALLRELQPAARVEVVPDAGHSVQRAQPAALAALLADFLGWA